LRTGKVGVLNEVRMERTASLTFTSESPMPVHYDGEFYKPMEQSIQISVIPAAIKLIGDWQH